MEYLHDPHPEGGFLTKATHVMWLATLDPKPALVVLAESPELEGLK